MLTLRWQTPETSPNKDKTKEGGSTDVQTVSREWLDHFRNNVLTTLEEQWMEVCRRSKTRHPDNALYISYIRFSPFKKRNKIEICSALLIGSTNSKRLLIWPVSQNKAFVPASTRRGCGGQGRRIVPRSVHTRHFPWFTFLNVWLFKTGE